jgi:hypothetical protein
MKTIARSKLAVRLLLLTAPLITMSYLRQPQPALATTCKQQCQNQLNQCSKMCNGNKFCIDACVRAYILCTKNCG